jgi:hypothetical protein
MTMAETRTVAVSIESVAAVLWPASAQARREAVGVLVLEAVRALARSAPEAFDGAILDEMALDTVRRVIGLDAYEMAARRLGLSVGESIQMGVAS